MPYSTVVATLPALAAPATTGPTAGHAAALAAASGQYLQVPDAAVFSIMNVPSIPVAMAGWFWLNANPTDYKRLVTKNSGSNATDEWFLHINPTAGGAGHPRLEVSVAITTPSYVSVRWGADVPNGQWVFVYADMAYVGGNIAMNVSENGGALVNSSQGGVAINGTGDPVRFGTDASVGASTFLLDGRLDAWGLWSGRTLIQSEVNSLYNGGAGVRFNTLPAGLLTNLAAWWDFDGPYNDGLWHDSTGLGHHATPHGGVTVTTGIT